MPNSNHNDSAPNSKNALTAEERDSISNSFKTDYALPDGLHGEKLEEALELGFYSREFSTIGQCLSETMDNWKKLAQYKGLLQEVLRELSGKPTEEKKAITLQTITDTIKDILYDQLHNKVEDILKQVANNKDKNKLIKDAIRKTSTEEKEYQNKEHEYRNIFKDNYKEPAESFDKYNVFIKNLEVVVEDHLKASSQPQAKTNSILSQESQEQQNIDYLALDNYCAGQFGKRAEFLVGLCFDKIRIPKHKKPFSNIKELYFLPQSNISDRLMKLELVVKSIEKIRILDSKGTSKSGVINFTKGVINFAKSNLSSLFAASGLIYMISNFAGHYKNVISVLKPSNPHVDIALRVFTLALVSAPIALGYITKSLWNKYTTSARDLDIISNKLKKLESEKEKDREQQIKERKEMEAVYNHPTFKKLSDEKEQIHGALYYNNAYRNALPLGTVTPEQTHLFDTMASNIANLRKLITVFTSLEEQLENANSSVQASEQTTKRLSEEITCLNTQVETLKGELEAANQKLKNETTYPTLFSGNNNEATSLPDTPARKQETSFHAQIRGLEERKKELEEENNQLEKKISQLSALVDPQRTEIEELKQKVEQQYTEMEHLRSTLERNTDPKVVSMLDNGFTPSSSVTNTPSQPPNNSSMQSPESCSSEEKLGESTIFSPDSAPSFNLNFKEIENGNGGGINRVRPSSEASAAAEQDDPNTSTAKKNLTSAFDHAANKEKGTRLKRNEL